MRSRHTFDHEFSHEPLVGRALSWLLAAALAALVMIALGAPPAQASQGTVFGFDEKRSEKLAPFSKWSGVLARYAAERGRELDPCSSGLFTSCDLQEWRKFINGMKSADKLAQLDAVNRYMNRSPYIIDPINYGVPDYWATPVQFFIKDGDCEDYAIVKYLSLRSLGWPAEKMRVVVLQDMNLNIAHAVLVVELNGTNYVLDNQISSLATGGQVRHYRPIYSINENAWWLHRRRISGN
ncbi:MAG: transglutaminase-like cysteine peptidase [Alphaproteobacteria bacterium]